MASFPRRRRLTLALATVFASLMLTTGPVGAQADYPSKQPVKLVIPFGAGGITDIVGRMIGQRLEAELGQTVVILNKPGAGGMIAAQQVSRADPDGYTLLMGTVGTQVVNQMLYSTMSYDPAAFTPVSLISNSPYIMAVNGIPDAKSLADVTAYAKANPGRLNFGSAGNGSSPHLGMELYKLASGTSIVHIPYKSGAEALNAALGGEVQIVVDAIPVINPQVKAGRLTAVAIANQQRSQTMPDLATSAEQGLPEFQIGSWNCFVAPANTPADRVAVLNAALKRVFAQPDLLAKLTEMGIEPLPLGVEAYTAHVDAERKKWKRVVAAAGTKLD